MIRLRKGHVIDPPNGELVERLLNSRDSGPDGSVVATNPATRHHDGASACGGNTPRSNANASVGDCRMRQLEGRPALAERKAAESR